MSEATFPATTLGHLVASTAIDLPTQPSDPAAGTTQQLPSTGPGDPPWGSTSSNVAVSTATGTHDAGQGPGQATGEGINTSGDVDSSSTGGHNGTGTEEQGLAADTDAGRGGAGDSTGTTLGIVVGILLAIGATVITVLVYRKRWVRNA